MAPSSPSGQGFSTASSRLSPKGSNHGLEGRDSGFWDSGLGIWDWEFRGLGIGSLDSGFGIGSWDFGLGSWKLGLGIWDWEFGAWKLEGGSWEFEVVVPGR